MNYLRVCAVTAVLFLLVPFLGPGALPAAYAHALASPDSRVLTGELVVTNGRRNEFRLVGHSGRFTASPEMGVETLDGKPVQVRFGRAGRVLQIAEMPIHIDPIEHDFERAQGQLIVSNGSMGTFMLAGDNRVYATPAGVDLLPYANRFVDVYLDERGRVIDVDLAPQRGAVATAGSCLYNEQRYPDGISLCQVQTLYRCEDGDWRNLGTACRSDSTVAYRSPRVCSFAGATVTDGSGICRNGWTFRCADGEWVNTWTACR